MEGVEVLRERRGDERVTFNELADHLEDFVRREPASGELLGRLAAFLASVEALDHDHDGEGPTLGDGGMSRQNPTAGLSSKGSRSPSSEGRTGTP